MQVIKVTEAQIREVVADYWPDLEPKFTRDPVTIWQFVHGNQGEVRPVATYEGPLLEIVMPTLSFSGCCSSRVGHRPVTLALVNGALYATEHEDSGPFKGDSVKLPSCVKIESSELSALRRRHSDLLAELLTLEDRIAALER